MRQNGAYAARKLPMDFEEQKFLSSEKKIISEHIIPKDFWTLTSLSLRELNDALVCVINKLTEL